MYTSYISDGQQSTACHRLQPYVCLTRFPLFGLEFGLISSYHKPFTATTPPRNNASSTKSAMPVLRRDSFSSPTTAFRKELQDAVFGQARAFFALPLEEKMKTSLSEETSFC
jgi:hypothetical protein